MRKTSLIIHQQPIVFLPDLAVLIGVNCAIVIQKLEFLLEYPDNGKEIDGKRWIYNTSDQWREKYFRFWSTDTIERAFLNLEKSSFVESIQPEGRDSRRKYYRISEAGYTVLTTKNIPEDRNLRCSEDGVLPMTATCGVPEDRNLRCSFKDNTTTGSSSLRSEEPTTSVGSEKQEDLDPKLIPQDLFAGETAPIPQPPIQSPKIKSKSESSLAKFRYRIARMFGRKTSTPWSKKEDAALLPLLATDEEDMLLLEGYYAKRGEHNVFCRENLVTLLNNWANDIDRARTHFAGTGFQKTAEDEEYDRESKAMGFK